MTNTAHYRKPNKISWHDWLRATAKFRRAPLETLVELQAKHGDLVYLRWPLKTLLVFHPEDIRDLLLKHASSTEKGSQSKKLQVVIGDGVFAAEGLEWRRKRKVVASTFHPSAIRSYQQSMALHFEDSLAAWPTNRPFDLSTAVTIASFRIAGEIFFGGVDPRIAPEVMSGVEAMATMIFKKISAIVPIAYGIPTPNHRRFFKERRFLDELVYRAIRQRRQDGSAKEDFLAQLLSQDHNLSDSEIRDEMVTLMVAGFETSSTLIAWTLHLLATDNRRLSECAEAARAVNLAKPEDAEYKYLVSLLKESMRLFPPSPLISRSATKPIEIGGKTHPVGTNFVMSQYVTHRDPRFWEDPLAFRPHRFLKNLEQKYAFLPFSLGPRSCIGEALAYTQTLTFLSTLFKKFDVTIVQEPRGMICDVLLRPDRPIRASLIKRS